MLPPEMAFVVLCMAKEENEWTSWVYSLSGEEKGPMLQPPGGSAGQLPTCRSAGEVTLSSTEPVRLMKNQLTGQDPDPGKRLRAGGGRVNGG